MSIQAADALMEIFGFKRVANDEITLDNPPSLDDDSGSLNEGMEMSEVKNEGLEVVCITQGGCNVTWTASKTLTPAGTALCSMPEAIAAHRAQGVV